ncbi:hypothetical protein KIM372_14300 [Bombiscardovia nodaiensis]|uniref:RCC1-like domain-containing protein n=1 Tax=Bombiscardovia nodaiensis TaxID=2932181 RepID=A0ABM8BAB8_9BIFI|nr:hypothetical protein KIM372_14300 [Bombiscardovia nodaiensis]
MKATRQIVCMVTVALVVLVCALVPIAVSPRCAQAKPSSVGPQAQYTVAFNDGKGGIYHISVDLSKTVPLQPIPQKDNSRFLGWYNGTLPYDFTQPVTSDLTLTGKWADTKFTLDPMRSPAEGGKLLTLTPPTIPATQFQQIITGQYHMLALDTRGRVYAWGRNDAGQIGDGTNVSRSTPTLITSLLSKRFIKVVAGPNDSFAFAEDGSIYAWGANAKSQLGLGTFLDVNTPTLIDQTRFGTNVHITDIFPGDEHTLALDEDGGAWGWGSNTEGQLGIGNTISQSTPVSIPPPAGASGYVSLSAGASHSFGITDDGTVYAWGGNRFGQLGNASFPTGALSRSTTPIRVDLPASGSQLIYVYAVADWSVAVGEDGQIYDWGYNGDFELGDGTVLERHTPTLVRTPAGETFEDIYTIGDGALVLSQSGKIYGWGYNPYGAIIGGAQPQRTPMQLNIPANIHPHKVMFGWRHAFIQDTEGNIWTWGGNEFGELGTDAPIGIGQGNATPAQIPTGQEKVDVTKLTIGGTDVTPTPVADKWQLTSPPHESGPTTVTVHWKLTGEQQEDYTIKQFVYEGLPIPAAGALPVLRRLGGDLLVLSLSAALAYALYQLSRTRHSSSAR